MISFSYKNSFSQSAKFKNFEIDIKEDLLNINIFKASLFVLGFILYLTAFKDFSLCSFN